MLPKDTGVENICSEAHNAGTQDICVPMQYFNIFLEPGGIISMMQRCIVAHWELVPEAKIAVCAILSIYTSSSMQCSVVQWMSASAVFYILNNAILYRLSCITMHDASHMIPQEYDELQFILSQINEVFGNSAAKRARVDADAHMIRASPGMRMDCVTQVQREQKEMYGVKMQSTREQWELANARLWLNNQIPGEHKSSTN